LTKESRRDIEVSEKTAHSETELSRDEGRSGESLHWPTSRNLYCSYLSTVHAVTMNDITNYQLTAYVWCCTKQENRHNDKY